VAVSLLDEQTNSLVRLAISASLLPPAVNAGILCLCVCESFERREAYRDYRQGGFYSLFLTLAIFLLIWISGMLMFRMKEVLPIKKRYFLGGYHYSAQIYQKRAVMLDVDGGATESSS
jgi:hypothetical protein